MENLELDPITWFSNRELLYKPKHFVVTKTPITPESKSWIYNKLRGRFCLVETESVISSFDMGGVLDIGSEFYEYPAFEDPSEATFYELTWS